MVSSPFDFVTRSPKGLERFVASIWYARGTIDYSRERIAPTGSTVAVFVLGAPILQTPNNGEGETFRAERGFLVGPHDRPAINEPTGETHAVGIVTTPLGCEAVFGVLPKAIRGKVVDLEAAWPRARQVWHGLRNLEGAEAKLDLVEGALSPAEPKGFARCEVAVQMLIEDPAKPVSDIAEALGLTHSHLDREVARIVGLSPRSLSRLLRMRRLLSDIDFSQDQDWAGRATELGWFDQAHLIRDFKRYTGVTPKQYIAAQRAGIPLEDAGNAAGFVPEA